MIEMIDFNLCGRIGEKIILGDENISTSTSDDLKRAAWTAMHYVKSLGMHEKKFLLSTNPNNLS